MLQEARARLADVETGDEPRPMRALQEASEPPQPGSRVSGGHAVKRSGSTPAAVAAPRGRPRPEAPIREQPQPVSAPPAIAGPDTSAAGLGTEELLWLEDASDRSIAGPDDDSTGIAPWRRGLRG